MSSASALPYYSSATASPLRLPQRIETYRPRSAFCCGRAFASSARNTFGGPSTARWYTWCPPPPPQFQNPHSNLAPANRTASQSGYCLEGKILSRTFRSPPPPSEPSPYLAVRSPVPSPHAFPPI